jgi:GNAT superfamily N-acetyltransferase
MDVTVERLKDLPADALAPLLAESEWTGRRFVRRLSDEWAAGANRFDRPGEALFAAWAAGRLVGVCGLNVDPYAADRRVGRLRRLYVLAEFRRLGVGRRLVQAVVAAARGNFAVLRLRAEGPEAAAFFARLGLRRVGAADCTHAVELEASAEPDRPGD